MFTTKPGGVVLFQHLSSHKIANRVKLTSYNKKNSPTVFIQRYSLQLLKALTHINIKISNNEAQGIGRFLL